jgi:hypothetical protein
MADKNLIVKHGLTAGNILIDSLTDSISTSTAGALQTKINLNVITSTSGSMIIPSGANSQRDVAPQIGYARYNTDSSHFEVYNGSAWINVGTGNAMITSATGSFVTPVGTIAQRDISPVIGYLRYNTDSATPGVEVYDGTTWVHVGASGTGGITNGTGSLITPAGTIVQRDAVPLPGYFRFNTQSQNFEGYTGTMWVDLSTSVLVLNLIDGGTYGSLEVPASATLDGGSF